MLTSGCIVKKIKVIDETLKLMTFEIYKYIPWEPGMFLQLSLDLYNPSQPWPESRAFSFASWGDRQAKILVRRAGDFTTKLFSELKEGSMFYIRYPFGDLTLSDPGDKVFIAAGAGISAFLSYIDYYIKKGLDEEVLIFHSVGNTKELMENILDYQIPERIKVFSFVTREKNPLFPNRRITINDVLSKVVTGKKYKYYICGDDTFVRKYWDELKNRGIDAVYAESWNKTLQ
ncbi:MAG TPA: FAD-dependent oxidoreductase [Fervidobacterium sp.]|nr:FAD-dependent oxidoreductase [Fervidobacterium sp.]